MNTKLKFTCQIDMNVAHNSMANGSLRAFESKNMRNSICKKWLLKWGGCVIPCKYNVLAQQRQQLTAERGDTEH